jgi:hypothetical protein
MGMDDRGYQGLIVAFYLSKYDKKALENLGCSTFKEVYAMVEQKLGIKPNTIKNQRDDFDPLMDNRRVGWYQRELSPSRQKIVDIFGEISEDALTGIVKDILQSENENNITIYTDSLRDELKDDIPSRERLFSSSRVLTGKAAENKFKEIFESGQIEGFTGELIDRRDDGCGYDYELAGSKKTVFEIKGLSTVSGGILLTDKEWQTAQKLRGNYHLVIISGIPDNPVARVISDPCQHLKPERHVRKAFSISWTVPSNQLKM